MLIRGPRHVRLRGLNERPEDDGDLSAELATQDEVPLVPDLLDALLDAVSVGIVVQRPDGTPVCVNAAAKALLGSDPVATLATAATSALRRGRLQQTVLDIRREPRSGGAHRGADGDGGEVLVTTVPIAPYGGPVAALVSTVSAESDAGRHGDDQSPDHVVEAAGARLQRALLRAEQHMLALTEHSSTGLAAVALDGRLLHVNPALARMLGRPSTELVGLHLADLDSPDGAPEAELLHRLAAGERDRFDGGGQAPTRPG